MKTALDAAIEAGVQPTAPRSGIGLVVKTLAGRFRTLVDKKGPEEKSAEPDGKPAEPKTIRAAATREFSPATTTSKH